MYDLLGGISSKKFDIGLCILGLLDVRIELVLQNLPIGMVLCRTGFIFK